MFDENSDAINVAIGGPKTNQQISARKKSFPMTKASFCFLPSIFSFKLIEFIIINLKLKFILAFISKEI